MISIIICSRSQELLKRVSASIDKTIGLPYEIIAIENGKGLMGICEAYNQGASKAKFDYLCFSHEDVVYHTQGWGHNVVDHLNDKETGVVGVCGARLKPKTPGGVWLNSSDADRLCMYNTDANGDPYLVKHNPDGEEKSEVITLDGVFLACRKAVWEENKFDEATLKNFHGYDVDFSLQVSRSYKNYVVYDIMLQHISLGRNNRAWVETVLAVEKKWKSYLPAYTKDFNKNQINQLEHYSLGYFLQAVIENKMIGLSFLKYYVAMWRRRPLSKSNLRLIKKILSTRQVVA